MNAPSSDQTPWPHVACLDCGCGQSSVEKWNRRTDATRLLAEKDAELQRLREALKEITDDYADRFDLNRPGTNPGIKYVIEQARLALNHP